MTNTDPSRRLQLRCVCGAAVPPGDIELSRLLAKCRACGSIFSIERHLGQAGLPVVSLSVPKPAGIKAVSTSEWHLDAGTHWSSYLGLLGAGFLTLSLRGFFSMSGTLGTLMGIGSLIASLPFVWLLIRGVRRRITVRLEHGALQVFEGSPQKGLRRGISAIKALFVKTDAVKTDAVRIFDEEVTRYALWALGPGGRETLLLRNIRSLEQALYLEQEIEQAIGLLPTAVEGEIEPPPRLRRPATEGALFGGLSISTQSSAVGGLSAAARSVPED